MKPIEIASLVALFSFSNLSTPVGAQSAHSTASSEQALPWISTPIDTMSTEHMAIESVTNLATGEVTQKTHRYISFGTGLNFTNNQGIIKESEE